MRFEMHVRDRELGEVFEYLFGLFYKYLVFVQCTQTHVVLSQERKTERRNKKFDQSFCTSWNERTGQKKRTDLYGSPPGKADAPRRVLEGNSPANRDEARHLEGLYAVRYAPYHLLGLRRRRRLGIHLLVCRFVKVDFGRECLDRAQRIPREAYVDFVYGLGSQRVAFLDDGGVGWVGLDGGGVLICLPY